MEKIIFESLKDYIKSNFVRETPSDEILNYVEEVKNILTNSFTENETINISNWYYATIVRAYNQEISSEECAEEIASDVNENGLPTINMNNFSNYSSSNYVH